MWPQVTLSYWDMETRLISIDRRKILNDLDCLSRSNQLVELGHTMTDQSHGQQVAQLFVSGLVRQKMESSERAPSCLGDPKRCVLDNQDLRTGRVHVQ
jgi:hypothetical protein